MDFIKYLRDLLTQEKFSLDVLNHCIMHFQYGGFVKLSDLLKEIKKEEVIEQVQGPLLSKIYR